MGEQGPRAGSVKGGDGRSSQVASGIDRCAHCGRGFAVHAGPGRPAKYCRRSCRQRAFEARRHVGDQAWVEGRLIEISGQLAEREDAVDRVREIIGELRVDLEDGRMTGLAEIIDRLEEALGPASIG